jgi:hypothetical protein
MGTNGRNRQGHFSPGRASESGAELRAVTVRGPRLVGGEASECLLVAPCHRNRWATKQAIVRMDRTIFNLFA